MRTFIAIELPAAIRETLRAFQDQLRADLRAQWCDHLRWTEPDKMHITLRFLGETSDEQRGQIEQGMAEAVAAHAPFSLRLSHLGSFPHWGRPRVLWAGVAGDLAALTRLQLATEAVAQAAGFDAETKDFHPHVTLGRVHRSVSAGDVRRMGRLLEQLAQERQSRQLPWIVTDLVYMRSELHRSGAQYTVMARWALSDDR